MPLPIVLASSSPYRKKLLEKLGMPFICHSPNTREQPLPDETPKALATRLASEKAWAVAKQYPRHLIIGSDQVAIVDNTVLKKPGNEIRAVKQLSLCSGKTATFFTGVTLLNSQTGQQQDHCEPFHATFRTLTQAQIRQYVQKEQPLDCVGSFKCEGLGVVLFEKMTGDDPNTLVGLPLIALTSMLLQVGIHPLDVTG
ncbi:nucleoside triphosphate pyrophosphatase [Candidatus Sororendozoicomonas aggregata]|uniref:Maf family protein n=1 Tax=Candidatus Sororendozoicomonas aggregata TaxID=3073239 RepID=UPI002ED1599A